MSNAFVWVDIPVRDLDRAIAFYSAVFGRPVEKQAAPGFTFGLFPHERDEVGGCLFVPAGDDGRPSTDGPLAYLDATGRLDAAIAAAQAHGGRVLLAKHSMGPHGWRAIVADTEGNRIALYSPTE
jgi:predicted enzyme related to lactoylglutathione lyase